MRLTCACNVLSSSWHFCLCCHLPRPPSSQSSIPTQCSLLATEHQALTTSHTSCTTAGSAGLCLLFARSLGIEVRLFSVETLLNKLLLGSCFLFFRVLWVFRCQYHCTAAGQLLDYHRRGVGRERTVAMLAAAVLQRRCRTLW